MKRTASEIPTLHELAFILLEVYFYLLALNWSNQTSEDVFTYQKINHHTD
jgi:hypothetical protein